MVFSSHIFLFGFLPLALLLYFAAPPRWRALVLTLESYVFYGWWNPWFVPLMLLSTAIDYVCGDFISREGASERSRKTALLTSIVSNLAILGFFKYALFFAESTSELAAFFGFGRIEAPDFLTHLVLPVGISFYTFQSMSYAIDLYRGHAERARSFMDFACYVAMYPQLVAGPIVRYQTVAHELRSRVHSLEGFITGMTRFNYGFAKKILLANPAGGIADWVFESGAPGPAAAWVGVLAYAFQIYFDFSAYSDMAIGLGRMMGFHFPENFNSPYRATSLADFWRRWHISLSTFLRDYLYVPLGGNRKGEVRTYLNLILVMGIGGFWHGAQWNFVIWGLLHGIALAVERWMKERLGWQPPAALGWIITMLVVLSGWVFFRTAGMEDALDFFASLGGAGSGNEITASVVFAPANLTVLATCALFAWALPNSAAWLRRVTPFKVALGLGLLVVSVRAMGLQGHNPFLYFQF